MGLPAYDSTSGIYKATLAILQANVSFSTVDLANILTVDFEAISGAATYNDVLQGSLETVILQSQDDGGTNAVNARFLFKDAYTVVEDYFLRWDVTDGDGGGPDGILDISDIAFIIYNFYVSSEGGPRWDEAKRFDANNDGIVDLADLLIIISYMGV